MKLRDVAVGDRLKYAGNFGGDEWLGEDWRGNLNGVPVIVLCDGSWTNDPFRRTVTPVSITLTIDGMERTFSINGWCWATNGGGSVLVTRIGDDGAISPAPFPAQLRLLSKEPHPINV